MKRWIIVLVLALCATVILAKPDSDELTTSIPIDDCLENAEANETAEADSESPIEDHYHFLYDPDVDDPDFDDPDFDYVYDLDVDNPDIDEPNVNGTVTTNEESDTNEINGGLGNESEDYPEQGDDGTNLEAMETQFRPRPGSQQDRPGIRRPPVDEYDVGSRPPIRESSRRVAFSVRKVGGRRRAPATLEFQDVLLNVGSGWQGNGVFKVPRPGVYFFTFHAVGGRNSDFTLSLFRGRRYQVTAYGTKPSFEHASNSVFLRLRRGERISLQLTQGRIYEHPRDEAYTTFSGFLLF